MFSIELKSRKVTIDLDAITVAEVRALTEKKDNGDEVLAKASGLTVEELTALPFRDYRKLIKFFWACLTDPLKDDDDAKNSQSESISQ